MAPDPVPPARSLVDRALDRLKVAIELRFM